MLNKIKSKIANIKKVRDLEDKLREVNEGASKELFEKVRQYRVILERIDYLDRCDPLAQELEPLRHEAEASKLRINEVIKTAKTRQDEVTLGIIRAGGTV